MRLRVDGEGTAGENYVELERASFGSIVFTARFSDYSASVPIHISRLPLLVGELAWCIVRSGEIRGDVSAPFRALLRGVRSALLRRVAEELAGRGARVADLAEAELPVFDGAKSDAVRAILVSVHRNLAEDFRSFASLELEDRAPGGDGV
jgi:hypothetical protein